MEKPREEFNIPLLHLGMYESINVISRNVKLRIRKIPKKTLNIRNNGQWDRQENFLSNLDKKHFGTKSEPG